MSQHSRVSVAVVQLGDYPAALLGRRSAIEEPLFDFKKRGVLSRDFPPGVGARLGDLRQRVRDAYLGQYQKRIKTILEHCSGWGVNLVVFPEYSIPWQLLETVATMADGVVIVAGTHAVDPAALRSNVYTKIGTIEPRLGEASLSDSSRRKNHRPSSQAESRRARARRNERGWILGTSSPTVAALESEQRA